MWRAAIIDAADEFYRRKMAPYEDQAIERNGDVQPVDVLNGAEYLQR
jgi:hypothetical protein